jgi:predicted transposase/invertase (TIGR01784 family)
MTLNPRGSEPLRLEYYAARLYASQDIQGSRKSFQDLSPTYQIALVGRKRLFPDQALVHRFQYYDPEHGVSLGGRTEIIMIELEKAADFAENPLGEMGPEEWWVLFFRYITDQKRRELMNKLMEYEEGIGMAGEVLLRLSRDEAERARLESEYKYRLDRQSDMVEARRRGKAEGLRRGERLLAAERQKNEARLRETARKLRDKGLSPGEIAGILGLDGVGGLSPEEPGH